MRRRLSALILLFALLLLACSGLVHAQSQPGDVLFPTAPDTQDSLVRGANFCSTTLTASLSSGATTASVVTTAGCASTGVIVLSNAEVATYTGKTSTSFTGLSRGKDGTAAATHALGATVRGAIVSLHQSAQSESIIRLQSKMGVGASTPTSGTFFQGTGAGTSGWLALSFAQVVAALGFTPEEALGYVPQPTDPDLTALAALVTTGLAKRTGDGTWTIVAAPSGTVVGTSDNQTLTNKTLSGAVVSNSSISGTLTGLTNSMIPAALSGKTISGSTLTNTNITGTFTGLTNPIIVAALGYTPQANLGYVPQPTDPDLTSLAGLSTFGLAKRVSNNTWSIVAAPTGAVVGTSDPQTLTNKTINGAALNNTTIGGTFVGITDPMLPNVLGNKTLNNATITGTGNGMVLNSPNLVSPTWAGPYSITGNMNVAGTFTATNLVGNCAGCTGIGSGTGGILNTGSTTIGADTGTPDGVGVISLQTRSIDRLNIGNGGGIGINVNGDYGLQYKQAQLNFKGFEGASVATRKAIWKAWSSDPNAPTAANFSLMGVAGPNPGTSRLMQGYYMGTNQAADGLEFTNEGQFLYGWETYWTGYPGSVSDPAQEHWWYVRGHSGTSAARVMFMYSPLNNPEQTSILWSMNAMDFGDWASSAPPWMRISPGAITWNTNAAAPHPRIVTDSPLPAILKGDVAYPFINAAGETEIARNNPVVRFASLHDSIDPGADYQFLLGAGSNRPGLRFNVDGGRGWEFSNNGTTYMSFAEGMKGVTRAEYTLGAAIGNYSTLGEVELNSFNQPVLAFTVVLSENNSIGDAGARVYHVLLPAYGTQNFWKEVLPIDAAFGLGADTGIHLDVRTTSADNKTTLRIRRSVAITGPSSIHAEIRMYTRGDAIFTTSTASGTGATVTDILQTVSASAKVQTLVVDYGDGVTDTKGAGAPTGGCGTGSTYRRTDGTAGATFYVCESSSWTAK